MRKRFRGPVPVSYRKNVEQNHQLYSGIATKEPQQQSDATADNANNRTR
jgi:hypothetical protein